MRALVRVVCWVAGLCLLAALLFFAIQQVNIVEPARELLLDAAGVSASPQVDPCLQNDAARSHRRRDRLHRRTRSQYPFRPGRHLASQSRPEIRGRPRVARAATMAHPGRIPLLRRKGADRTPCPTPAPSRPRPTAAAFPATLAIAQLKQPTPIWQHWPNNTPIWPSWSTSATAGTRSAPGAWQAPTSRRSS